MRTLNRPMFNMGGPIKQGIMHGIREPYRGGQLVQPGPGRPGYAGEGYFENLWGAAKKFYNPAGKPGKIIKNIKKIFKTPKPSGNINPAAWKEATTHGVTGTKLGQQFLRNLKDFSFPGSAKALGYAKKGLTYVNPFRKPKTSLVGGVALTSDPAREVYKNIKPISKWVAEAALPGWAERKFLPWKTETDIDGFLKSAAAGGASLKEIAAAKKLSDEEKNAFAITQRNDRVEKYLKMMGYDRAKKTAIADALIDASKNVGDRGTLDLKNIGQDLINPIIQATSKRLDKPDQIREAVGLMSVKAEIEKDLEDPSIKALRLEQLKGLRGGFAKDMGDFVLSARGEKVKPKALERVARARAHEHKLDFTVVTDEMIAKAGEGASEEQKIQAVVSGDGVYLIGDAIIQVIDGIPKQVA